MTAPPRASSAVEPVTVRSANGEFTGIAKIDDSIRRGAVSIPHGHHEANVNRLTNKDDIDVVTGMVRYSGHTASACTRRRGCPAVNLMCIRES